MFSTTPECLQVPVPLLAPACDGNKFKAYKSDLKCLREVIMRTRKTVTLIIRTKLPPTNRRPLDKPVREITKRFRKYSGFQDIKVMAGSMLRIYDTRDPKLVRIRDNRVFDYPEILAESDVVDGDVFEFV